MLIHAERALLPDGWASEVAVTVTEGRIARVDAGQPAARGERVGVLLPAPVNLHSHLFQRAMAGLTEARGAGGQDSFWTWRNLMYRFLEQLTPEDVQAIAAQAMVEMAEAGFGALAEFHYLHHAPGGVPYADPAEMAARIAAAAAETGLGLTLLPVLYQRGGCDGRALAGGQLRFGCDERGYLALREAARRALSALPADTGLGVAPHSLRAVDRAGLHLLRDIAEAEGVPFHIHAAEQLAEVAEVQAHIGARPVEYLDGQGCLTPRACVIHATQMRADETEALARSGAVAGLCPITEANLGDGIFDGPRFVAAGGVFGMGSDSNVQITLAGELRLFEYSQRLARRGRAVMAEEDRSTGRLLFEGAALGGARAAGREAGRIAPGAWADLLGLDRAGDLEGREGDRILDSFVFARGEAQVAALWSAGRQIVAGGRHVAREAIAARYRAVMARLGAGL